MAAQEFLICGDDQGRIFLRDSALRPISQLLLGNDTVQALATWRDGGGIWFIYVAAGDNVFVVTINNQQLEVVRQVHHNAVVSLAVTPYGQVFSGSTANTLCGWTPRMEELIFTVPLLSQARAMCVLEIRELLCVGDELGQVMTFDYFGIYIAPLVVLPFNSIVTALFSENETVVIGHFCGSWGVCQLYLDGTSDYVQIFAGDDILDPSIIGCRVRYCLDAPQQEYRYLITLGTLFDSYHLFFRDVPVAVGDNNTVYTIRVSQQAEVVNTMSAFDVSSDGNFIYGGFTNGQVWRRGNFLQPTNTRHRQVSPEQQELNDPTIDESRLREAAASDTRSFEAVKKQGQVVIVENN